MNNDKSCIESHMKDRNTVTVNIVERYLSQRQHFLYIIDSKATSRVQQIDQSVYHSWRLDAEMDRDCLNSHLRIHCGEPRR